MMEIATSINQALPHSRSGNQGSVAYLDDAETPQILRAALGEIPTLMPLRRKSDQTTPVRLGHAVEAKAMLEARAMRDKIVLEAYAAWVTIESTPAHTRTPGQEYFIRLMDQYECQYALLHSQPDGESTRVIKDTLNSLARNEPPPTASHSPPPEITDVPSPMVWAAALEQVRLNAVIKAQSRPSVAPPSVAAGFRRRANDRVRLPKVTVAVPKARRATPPKSAIAKGAPKPLWSSSALKQQSAADTEAILRNSQVEDSENASSSLVDALFDESPVGLTA